MEMKIGPKIPSFSVRYVPQQWPSRGQENNVEKDGIIT